MSEEEYKESVKCLNNLLAKLTDEGFDTDEAKRSLFNLLQAYKEQEKVIDEKEKLIESMKNFLFKTCMMADFLEWKKDFDKVKENK